MLEVVESTVLDCLCSTWFRGCSKIHHKGSSLDLARLTDTCVDSRIARSLRLSNATEGSHACTFGRAGL